jgi:FKBP-type peptidyl-prolyl cis-trans isomerase
MKKILATVFCLGLAAPLFADGTNQLADERSRVSYAIGLNIGHNFKTQGVDVDTAIMVQALNDVLQGRPEQLTEAQVRETLQAFQMTLRKRQQARMQAEGQTNKMVGDAFFTTNKLNPDVKVLSVTLPDGKTSEMQYIVITNGSGEVPTAKDTVTVNYRGTLLDGTEFDSSYKRGQPAKFPVTGVIKGWTQALEMMPVGSQWKLFIPPDLAYGEGGRPGIPPNSTLVFDVELLNSQAPAPPPPPAAPLTSDIIKVPSADELKKGAKIEVIKQSDLQKAQQQTNQ